MSEYTTLVFKTGTPESLEDIRKFAGKDACRAWSMDHEIHRLALIEEAAEARDLELIQEIIDMIDVGEIKDLEEVRARLGFVEA